MYAVTRDTATNAFRLVGPDGSTLSTDYDRRMLDEYVRMLNDARVR